MFPRFQCTEKLESCRGFIADGDYAIEWREDSLEAKELSVRSEMFSSNLYLTILHAQGTLPFISMHLLSAWLSQVEAIHTPIDDLESFLWVSCGSLCKF